MVADSAHENRLAGAMTFEEIEHELRTPLASMRSVSEIMRDYPDLTDDQRQRFLDAILDDNARLARMVERLLNSVALQNGLS
ncbi:MAG: histidine kinase dimerization/phospho-acceptor domain-containing protein [Geminicoccaceae bacterium]